MNSLIPSFDPHQVFVVPWTDGAGASFWIVLMGFLTASACGLVGNYLILRRMALVGDAISHSVLPGLAIAFLISSSRSSWVMFLGALAAGMTTTVLIELIHRKSRVKQDAAIGITFSTLFAIGVILICVFADRVDLDQECVLYGEIGFVPFEPMVAIAGIGDVAPEPVFRMGIVALVVVAVIAVFYKELLIASFDPGIAVSMGINTTFVHYGLMCLLSVVVVSAFESVGAILVIAMLIVPGATAYLLTDRFPVMMGLTVAHAAISSLVGLHLGIWLDCSIAGAMVTAGFLLFVLAWVFSPSQGLLARWRRRSALLEPVPEAAS